MGCIKFSINKINSYTISLLGLATFRHPNFRKFRSPGGEAWCGEMARLSPLPTHNTSRIGMTLCLFWKAP